MPRFVPELSEQVLLVGARDVETLEKFETGLEAEPETTGVTAFHAKL